MKIRMLGPFAVGANGRSLKLAGPKQRAVLSVLALNANAPVSLERLVDGIWGEEPPATAPKMVQQYVSQLRRLLADAGGAEILTRGHGYELRIDPSAVDVLRFAELVERAGRESAHAALAHDALALWAGEPLMGFDEPFAAAEARRLNELHLGALELSIRSDLEAGREAEVISRLRAMVEEHPLRERLRVLLMLALYRSGRQAEALEAFHEARWTLVETLGLEPGPELRRVQEAILRQDPALETVVPDEGWASRETVQRLDAGAGRISRRRGELRADERELAGDVIDLQQLRERTAREIHGDVACPFKGLEAFDAADAGDFFGREVPVADVVARLPGTSLLGVIGPSGSGKSSLVRAGLLPALGSGVLPGSERWTRAVMRPGEQPMRALRQALRGPEHSADPVADALAGIAAGSRLLLVVDQFEEAFTACRDDAQRARFLDAIVAPAARGDGSYLAVLVVRADFYGACAGHRRLARLLGESHVLVGPMRADELRRAVEAPTRRAGLEIEPDLVAELVYETAGRPGGLPLLSTTLLELWQRRSGTRLTARAYEEIGGVQGAVGRLAETAYDRLTPPQAAAARNLLLRLAGDDGPEAAVRRQVPLAELDLARSADARRVLDVLTENRLLTVSRETVEVAHEALLREWPRLRAWLEEDAEARRLHRHITLAAREWDAGGRDPAELYRGARLASALDFGAEAGDALNALERAFLDEARLSSEREAVRARRQNRRLRTLLVVALAGLVATVAAGLVALDQRTDARRAAQVADAQRLGSQALTDERLDRALLLARAAVSIDDSAATRSSLLATLLRTPSALLGVFPVVDDAEIYDVAVSPSGDAVAFADAGGALRVFALPARRHVGTYRMGLVQQVAFAPDGRTLAVAGLDPSDRTRVALVDIVDAGTLRRRRRIELPAPHGRVDFVGASPGFLADGRTLLVLETPFGGDQPHLLHRFDVRTGAPIGQPLRIAASAPYALLITRDGRRIFVPDPTADTTTEIDTATWKVLRRHPVGGTIGAIDAGGRRLAVGTTDGRIRLVDLVSGQERALEGGHGEAPAGLRFAPDGRTLVSSGDDGAIVVWDAATGRLRERLRGHTSRVEALAVSPRGEALFSAGHDGQALLWDLTGRQRLLRSIPLGTRFDVDDPTPRGSAVSPDGRTLAVTNADGTVDLVDAETLERRSRLRVGSEAVLAVAFSPDGRLIATATEHGRVALWDAATLTPVGDLPGLTGWTQALAFSPDGRLLAASAVNRNPGRLRIWDVRRRALTAFRSRTAANALAFSPDGALIAAAAGEAGGEIRDVRTGRLVTRLEAEAIARSVTFSPDGTLLFLGRFDGTGQFFSTHDWRAAGQPIRGQTQRLTAAGFTPDGQTLATASADGTVMLWDVGSRKPIGSPLRVQRDDFVAAALAPSGDTLYALPTGGTGVRLALGPAAWKRHACRVAGRELTSREWRAALPRQEYRMVCGRGRP